MMRPGLFGRICVLSMLSSQLVIIPAAAAAPVCTSGGSGYTVTLCVVAPADQAVVSGLVTVSADTTISGSATSVQRMNSYLDGIDLLEDVEAPFTFQLPTDRFSDGPHLLEVRVTLRNGFTSSLVPINLTFENGVTTPPINTNSFSVRTGGEPPPGQPFVLAATGDGAGGRHEADEVVSLVQSWNPDLFAYLGDVYGKGTTTEFFNWYGHDGSAYSALAPITNPAIGNHEYQGGAAPGYFDYWDNVPNYYSYDANGWHIVVLDSTSQSGSLMPGSAQYEWLVGDLAASSATCSAAYFHHPVISKGPQGDTSSLHEIWQVLVDQGVDLVLTAHDHQYQRWVPLDRNLVADPSGVPHFVVGSGGHGIQALTGTDPRLVAFADNPVDSFGALRLQLNEKGADFAFVNTSNVPLDAGAISCSGAAPDTTGPSAPTTPTAVPASHVQVDLGWGASLDDSGVSSYRIYRDGAPLAEVASLPTTFTDTTVSQNTSYLYEIEARDPSGNASNRAGVAVTTPALPAAITVAASADAYVNASNPASTYGSASMLRVDASPDIRSYLRFDVVGLSGQPGSAILRIYSNSTSSSGVEVHLSGGVWGESTISYGNAPAFDPGVVGSSGPMTSGQWSEIDLGGLVTQNGSYTVVLTGSSNTGVSMASRESGFSPELVIDTAAPQNAAPVASAIDLSGSVDQPILVGLSGADGNGDCPLVFTVSTPPAHGTLGSLTGVACSAGVATGDMVFTPDAGFTGADSFSYTVSDGSLVSVPALVTLTVAPVQSTLVLNPTADSYVNASNSTSTYGLASVLRVDASPDIRSYLRFDVVGLSGQPGSATLRIYSNSTSSSGVEVHLSGGVWGESTISYGNAPAFDPGVVGSSGPMTSGQWSEIDLGGLVTQNGSYTVVLTGSSNTGVSMASRESGFSPELVIDTAAPQNAAPVAVDGNASTTERAPVVVLLQGSDLDGTCPLSFVIASPPSAGSLGPVSNVACSAGVASAEVTYTPNPGFTGVDTFTHTVDDASSTSTPATTSVAVSAAPSFVLFAPSNDAYVSGAKPSTNYGSASMIRVDASPDVRSYLSFEVAGVVGTPTFTVLRVRSNSNSSTGFDVHQGTGEAWSESSINYGNAPSFDAAIIGSSGPISSGQWVEIDVSNIVTVNGVYTLVLTGTSNTGISLASRNSATSPELIVHTSG